MNKKPQEIRLSV